MKKRIALLGATGSIGDSALSVVAQFAGRFEIVSMSAGIEPREAPARHRRAPAEGRVRDDARRRGAPPAGISRPLGRVRPAGARGRGDASRSRRRPRRHRGVDRTRARLRGREARQDAGAREQGDARRRRRAPHGRRPRLRLLGPARGLGALRAPPGPARGNARGGEASRPHRVRRTFPHARLRDVRGDHARRRPPPSDLEDGAEDHDRLGHDDEQGARGHRGPLALRRAGPEDRRRPPPAVDRSLDGRVRGRLRARADVAERHAFPDPLRAHVSRARSDAAPGPEPHVARPARVLPDGADALSGRRARVRRARDGRLGAGRAQRRERDRGPGVSRPPHSLSRDRRAGRPRSREAQASCGWPPSRTRSRPTRGRGARPRPYSLSSKPARGRQPPPPFPRNNPEAA